MLVLLPPSERKLPARRGSPLDLAALTHPALSTHRRAVLEALAEVSGRPDAAALLGVGRSTAPEVGANTRWASEPAREAGSLFTGVLYDALGLASMESAARRRATGSVRVVSAAYGLLGLRDRVPAHRLAMGTDLPGIGPLARSWRPLLSAELDPLTAADGQVVLDARSAAYAAAWRPPRALADRVVEVAVVVAGPGGDRTVVSHHAKHARGLLARHLLESGPAPRSVDALAERAARAFTVEMDDARPGRQRRLTVVLRPPQP